MKRGDTIGWLDYAFTPMARACLISVLPVILFSEVVATCYGCKMKAFLNILVTIL